MRERVDPISSSRFLALRKAFSPLRRRSLPGDRSMSTSCFTAGTTCQPQRHSWAVASAASQEGSDHVWPPWPRYLSAAGTQQLQARCRTHSITSLALQSLSVLIKRLVICSPRPDGIASTTPEYGPTPYCGPERGLKIL